MDDKTCEAIKLAYKRAVTKADFDAILKQYNIKIMKNGRLVSAARVKLDVKKAIIRMAFYEPGDVFHFDSYKDIH